MMPLSTVSRVTSVSTTTASTTAGEQVDGGDTAIGCSLSPAVTEGVSGQDCGSTKGDSEGGGLRQDVSGGGGVGEGETEVGAEHARQETKKEAATEEKVSLSLSLS